MLIYTKVGFFISKTFLKHKYNNWMNFECNQNSIDLYILFRFNNFFFWSIYAFRFCKSYILYELYVKHKKLRCLTWAKQNVWLIIIYICMYSIFDYSKILVKHSGCLLSYKFF